MHLLALTLKNVQDKYYVNYLPILRWFRFSSDNYTYVLISLLQALKALAHNYPNVMTLCWEQISSIIYGVLSSFSDVPGRLWRGNVEHTVAPIKERVMTAAVKVDHLPFYMDDFLISYYSFQLSHLICVIQLLNVLNSFLISTNYVI